MEIHPIVMKRFNKSRDEFLEAMKNGYRAPEMTALMNAGLNDDSVFLAYVMSMYSAARKNGIITLKTTGGY